MKIFSTIALALALTTTVATAADLGGAPYGGSIKDSPAPMHYYGGGLFMDFTVGQAWKGDFSWTVGEADLGIRVPRGNGSAWAPYIGYMGSFSDDTIEIDDRWTSSASINQFKVMPLVWEFGGDRLKFNFGAGIARTWMDGSKDYTGSGCGCDPDQHLDLEATGWHAPVTGGLDLAITERVGIKASYEHGFAISGEAEDYNAVKLGLSYKFN